MADVQTTLLNTAGNDLSPEMKPYYDKALIHFAQPQLVHAKFGQKRNIPANNGTEAAFRKFSPLPKALTPLTEGVTPAGNALNVTKMSAKVKQYGDYITTSDILNLSSFDNIAEETQKVLGDQAGRTLDTVVKEIINAGTNVQYGNGKKVLRSALSGGEDTGNDYLTVDAVRAAVRTLKRNNTNPLKNGHYVAIIHPDVAYDLMADPEWQAVKAGCDPEDWYEGAIGRIAGVVFVESTEGKVFSCENLIAGSKKLTVSSVLNDTITVSELVTADEAAALVSRTLLIGSYEMEVTAATAGAAGAATVTVSVPSGVTLSSVISAGGFLYAGEAGAKARDIYSTLIIGADAYGVTNIEGGGLETIAKQAGSAGTSDPLNQRSTMGWKATQTACILSPEFMVRIETACSF
ncbi:MAG: N4-gp56 family major capsid protein [Bacillota bacterium]|nr:N4-gp56 family major capsid protein [Bacillota bacterium]